MSWSVERVKEGERESENERMPRERDQRGKMVQIMKGLVTYSQACTVSRQRKNNEGF